MTVETPLEKPPASQSDRSPRPQVRWYPVRALAPRHRPRILTHLLALDERDRYLRFGHAVSDAHIARYVDQLDFDRDEVFGVFNRRLDLVAMCHLAYQGHDLSRPTSAEFGVSVLPRMRGRGLGARLFDLATLHARNRGVDTLIVYALTENTTMLRIARNAGAVLEREGAEATARLKLPKEDFASRLEELVETQAAEVDYSFKRQAHQLDNVLQRLRESLPGSPPSAPGK